MGFLPGEIVDYLDFPFDRPPPTKLHKSLRKAGLRVKRPDFSKTYKEFKELYENHPKPFIFHKY